MVDTFTWDKNGKLNFQKNFLTTITLDHMVHINKHGIKSSNCVRNQFWALTFNWTQLENDQLAEEFAG